MVWRRWNLSKLKGDLLPFATEIYSIGSENKKWLAAFITTLIASVFIVSGYLAGSEGVLWINMTTKINGSLEVRDNLTINNSDLFVDSSTGRVGIGTTSPESKLTLSDNAIVTPIDEFTDYQILLHSTGTNAARSYGLGIEGSTLWLNSDANFRFYRDGSNVDMILSSGKVGIGTTSPSEKLSVMGNVSLNNTLYVLENGNVGIGTTSPSEKLSVMGNVSLNNSLYVLENGNVGIGTTSPNASLHVSEGSVGGSPEPTSVMILERTGNLDFQFMVRNGDSIRLNFGDKDDRDDGRIRYDHNSRSMSFRTGNAERMIIDSSGNVGINQTSPAELLDVQGIIKRKGEVGYSKYFRGDAILMLKKIKGETGELGDWQELDHFSIPSECRVEYWNNNTNQTDYGENLDCTAAYDRRAIQQLIEENEILKARIEDLENKEG